MREISNELRILSVTKINKISAIIESLENQLTKCQSTVTSFVLVSILLITCVSSNRKFQKKILDQTKPFSLILFPFMIMSTLCMLDKK